MLGDSEVSCHHYYRICMILSCVDQNPRKAHPSMSVDGIILLVIQPVDLKMCFFSIR